MSALARSTRAIANVSLSMNGASIRAAAPVSNGGSAHAVSTQTKVAATVEIQILIAILPVWRHSTERRVHLRIVMTYLTEFPAAGDGISRVAVAPSLVY